MTYQQWEAFDLSAGAAGAGSLAYVPEPPPTRPSMTVVAPPPAGPVPPVVAAAPTQPGPPSVPEPPKCEEAPKGHHFLVYFGMALMFIALVARVVDTLVRLDLLATASFQVMALGAVVFVLGRMIRLEIH